MRDYSARGDGRAVMDGDRIPCMACEQPVDPITAAMNEGLCPLCAADASTTTGGQGDDTGAGNG